MESFINSVVSTAVDLSVYVPEKNGNKKLKKDVDKELGWLDENTQKYPKVYMDEKAVLSGLASGFYKLMQDIMLQRENTEDRDKPRELSDDDRLLTARARNSQLLLEDKIKNLESVAGEETARSPETADEKHLPAIVGQSQKSVLVKESPATYTPQRSEIILREMEANVKSQNVPTKPLRKNPPGKTLAVDLAGSEDLSDVVIRKRDDNGLKTREHEHRKGGVFTSGKKVRFTPSTYRGSSAADVGEEDAIKLEGANIVGRKSPSDEHGAGI
jgi:hypothetical protein